MSGYNDRGELVSAQRRSGTTVGIGTDFTADGLFAFAYDAIGNRATSGKDGNNVKYCITNNLNQYESVINASLSNCPSPQFSYDAEGNLTKDATFNYTWDRENRLIRVEPVLPQNNDVRVLNAYDHLGRRVHKTVQKYNGSSWTTNADLRFIYDGWNVVEVVDRSWGVANAKYTWGLDLSGQAGNASASGIQGAGGIGGLLASDSGTPSSSGSSVVLSNVKQHWYFYDANGNVGQLLDATSVVTGGAANTSGIALAAAYEYDPYGNTIAKSGSFADINPFRFSTKWLDGDVGLYYYGYRFYSSSLGRWINRDPIEEKGFELLRSIQSGRATWQDPLREMRDPNRYAFVVNQPISLVDYLGLCNYGMVRSFTTYGKVCWFWGVQQCRGCQMCLISGILGDPSTWSTYWYAFEKCGTCCGSGTNPLPPAPACPSSLSGSNVSPCQNFINGRRTEMNCQACCDIQYQTTGPGFALPPIDDKLPTKNDCYIACRQYPPQ